MACSAFLILIIKAFLLNCFPCIIFCIEGINMVTTSPVTPWTGIKQTGIVGLTLLLFLVDQLTLHNYLTMIAAETFARLVIMTMMEI